MTPTEILLATTGTLTALGWVAYYIYWKVINRD